MAAIVFGIAVVASMLAHVAILASVVRRASGVVDSGVPRPRPIVEVVWALIPLLVLALVFTATWSRMRDREPQPAGATMRIAR